VVPAPHRGEQENVRTIPGSITPVTLDKAARRATNFGRWWPVGDDHNAGGAVLARQRGSRHSRALSAVAAVIATSLVAAGCGMAGGSSSSTSSAAACNTPGYSANEIQLGFIYPNTGAVAPALSASKSGFDARIAEANAAGGIYGRKIVTSWRDDAATPGQNLEAAQDLVERQKVFSLVEATVAAGGCSAASRARAPPQGLSDRRQRVRPRTG
jgi:hypothetical protein